MNKITNICSIDASTNSLAFAIFDKNKKTLNIIGKLLFIGNNTYEKIADAYSKTRAVFDLYKIDGVVIEHTVFMNSPRTAADLALIQGGILAALWQSGVEEVGSVAPITWQNFIGNKKLTKEEKFLIKSQNPDKSVSWLKSYERNIRKQRTIKFININYDKNIDDNDVADACAIGHWAINNWEKLTK